jgi:gas vesicle protein
MSYYVTRQLSRAIEKLSNELRETLQQQIDAIRDSAEATRENKQSPMPSPLPVHAELQLPEADRTEQRTQHQRSHGLQIWLTVGTWLAFIAAAIYAGFAYYQLREMRQTNVLTKQALDNSNQSLTQTLNKMQGQIDQMSRLADNAKTQADRTRDIAQTSKDALISVQRAFVLPSSQVDPMVIENNGTQSVRFTFHWENSGVTPARGTMHVSYRWNTAPLPDDFPFSDWWGEGQPHVNTPFIAGAKGTVGISVGPVPIQVIEGMQMNPPLYHLNFWGWAKYRDVFKNTHLTEFCSELIPIDVQSSKDDPNKRTVRYDLSNCSRHNCYDEECKTRK